jgi:hypothetical protein
MKNIILHPIPRGFVKGRIESIWPGGNIVSHFLDDGVELVAVRDRIGEGGKIRIR